MLTILLIITDLLKLNIEMTALKQKKVGNTITKPLLMVH